MPFICNGENYTYLNSGTFNDVYINEKSTYVLKVYKDESQQRTVAERNARVWNACKRSEIGKAEYVTFEIDGSNVSAMKVPFLPFKIANKICYDALNQQKEAVITKVITAVRKESIRIFLSTGRIIADGHLDNFLYDEKNNTAHCIDHDLAHDVTLTELSTNRDTFSNQPQHQEDFTFHLELTPDMNQLHPDETGIGRALNAMFSQDTTYIGKQLNEIFKSGIFKVDDIREKLIDKMSDVMSKTIKYEADDYTPEEIGNFAKALEEVIWYSEVIPLFHVQSDIRAYVNLRLGADTTLQGVQDKAKGDWQGKYKKEGKLSLLKKLLTSIQQCNPTDTGSLESLLKDIQEAKKNNLKMEGDLFGSGITFGMYQTVRANFKNPGGELGKLLNNCEKHVNKIKAGLNETPTPRA